MGIHLYIYIYVPYTYVFQNKITYTIHLELNSDAY